MSVKTKLDNPLCMGNPLAYYKQQAEKAKKLIPYKAVKPIQVNRKTWVLK